MAAKTICVDAIVTTRSKGNSPPRKDVTWYMKKETYTHQKERCRSTTRLRLKIADITLRKMTIKVALPE
jgi:hypothetical protein